MNNLTNQQFLIIRPQEQFPQKNQIHDTTIYYVSHKAFVKMKYRSQTINLSCYLLYVSRYTCKSIFWIMNLHQINFINAINDVIYNNEVIKLTLYLHVTSNSCMRRQTKLNENIWWRQDLTFVKPHVKLKKLN